jgi:hypothetical protein
MLKKLFDSLVIFRHISPVFLRGQSTTVFFKKFFLSSKLDL